MLFVYYSHLFGLALFAFRELGLARLWFAIFLSTLYLCLVFADGFCNVVLSQVFNSSFKVLIFSTFWSDTSSLILTITFNNSGINDLEIIHFYSFPYLLLNEGPIRASSAVTEASPTNLNSKEEDLVFVAGATGKVGSRTVRLVYCFFEFE